MRYKSIVTERGSSEAFPAFIAERVYMRQFWKRSGLPADLSRWQSLVDSMLVGVDTDLPIYLMVDQKRVAAGEYHRRAGLHIDGYWGGSGWGHISAHGSAPSRHGTDPAPTNRHGSGPSVGGHGSAPRTHSSIPDEPSGHGSTPRHSSGNSNWSDADFRADEAIILVSNVAACRAYEGDFDGPIGEMGDCAAIDVSHATPVLMKPGVVYAGNVTMLHETLPCMFDCERTVVRLNVPGWSPACG